MDLTQQSVQCTSRGVFPLVRQMNRIPVTWRQLPRCGTLTARPAPPEFPV